MPIIELESASLRGGSQNYESDVSGRGAPGLRSAASDSDFSSIRGKRNGQPDFRPRSTRSEGHQAAVKNVLTNFTESLSHSTEEIQEGLQKTFSSIVSSFSRDASSSASESGSGESSGSSSSGYTSESPDKKWINFPDRVLKKVSSLTSRSTSYNTASSHDSTLSSRSNSPRMNSDRFAITVDNSGFVLRESTDEDSNSSGDDSSVSSWQDSASRDRSLLDTIGESREEDEESSDDGGSRSSESGSEGDDFGVEDEARRGKDGVLYDYDDDASSEFGSDVGLEDLGAVMLQIGSCQFEPESASMSFDDEEYSYKSGLFPKVVSNYLEQTIGQSGDKSGDDGANTAELCSEAARNAIFQKQLQQRQRKIAPPKKQDSITTFFNKAFSCGAGQY